MKIIAIGRNYAAHAAELGNPVPDDPVIFLKPDTALLKDNRDFYYPEFSEDIHFELEVVLRICKEGKHIHHKFAHQYYDQIGIGIDFTARDMQQQLKEKGLPWELAKAFDHSAAVSDMRPKASFNNMKKIGFSLLLNGKEVQKGNTESMLFSFDDILTFVSTRITLRKGDLIFTGTPPGVGPVQIGDRIEGFLEAEKLLDFHIK